VYFGFQFEFGCLWVHIPTRKVVGVFVRFRHRKAIGFKWFRYSTKICKGTGPACICLSIFYATGCSSFGAVSRAKSVLSGADSAGAGSMEVVQVEEVE
jgi:hypothetical protein